MVTPIHEPPLVDPNRLADHGNSADGARSVALDYSPPASATAIWVVLFAITMMFAAFTSALIVRKGSSLDWRTFKLPSILFFNTGMLLASGATLEVSRRRIAAFMGGLKSQVESPARWLYVTLLLGLLFVAGQYVAWSQLSAQGLYLATNPSSSFFYVLTATHALHVLGGLAGLGYVIRKLNKRSLRRSTLDATARYWHFMDGLWVYLLLLLWMKL
jgi:cytochrome c oxidase subunit 3